MWSLFDQSIKPDSLSMLSLSSLDRMWKKGLWTSWSNGSTSSRQLSTMRIWLMKTIRPPRTSTAIVMTKTLGRNSSSHRT